MSEELTVVDYAKKAGQLNNKQILSLVGNVQGTVEFDGTKEVSMTTTIERGDITNTTITFEKLSITEGIKSGQKTGEIVGEIVNRFEEIEKGLENKLGKTEIATSAEKLSKEKKISLVGNVKGSVAFDGSKDVEIQTEITGGDIKDTVVSFTESSIREEINSGESTSKIFGKIKKWFKDLKNVVWTGSHKDLIDKGTKTHEQIDTHLENKSNPHGVSKEQLGLGNVENTKDINKPISNATQSALDNKLGKNDKAKDSDLLDGKDGSYYAPIENPSFDGNINVKGKMITKGLVKEMKIIDLSTLNQDLYYPVITDIPAGKGFFEIIVDMRLDVGAVPNWSTHAKGFSCHQHMLVIRDGCGHINPESICLARNTKWTKNGIIPIGYSQMTQSSKAVLWLRGGGKYFVWDSNNSNWEIKTTEYINNQQSVKPQSTVVFEFVKSTIHANIQADNITSVTPAVADNSTKVATTSFTHSAIASDRAYSTSVPVMNGSASAGSSNDVSRGNHVHPTDSTRAPVLNPTLTGTVSINNTNTKLNQGSCNSLRITTPSGWTDIGSQNSGWSHFQTDRPQFYFDKPITVNGDITSYNNVKRTINGYNLNGNALTADSSKLLSVNNNPNGTNNFQYMQLYGDNNTNDNYQSNWSHVIKMNHGNGDTHYSRHLAFDFHSHNIYTRFRQGGINKGWKKLVLDGDSPSFDNLNAKNLYENNARVTSILSSGSTSDSTVSGFTNNYNWIKYSDGVLIQYGNKYIATAGRESVLNIRMPLSFINNSYTTSITIEYIHRHGVRNKTVNSFDAILETGGGWKPYVGFYCIGLWK